MDEEEHLKKQMTAIEKKQAPIAEKLRVLQEKKMLAYKESLIGKCFVFRRNCYSCPKIPSDYFDTFYKITCVEDYGVGALVIEKDSNGRRSIEQTYCAVHGLGRNPNDMESCTQKEFDKNYDKILKDLGLKRRSL